MENKRCAYYFAPNITEPPLMILKFANPSGHPKMSITAWLHWPVSESNSSLSSHSHLRLRAQQSASCGILVFMATFWQPGAWLSFYHRTSVLTFPEIRHLPKHNHNIEKQRAELYQGVTNLRIASLLTFCVWLESWCQKRNLAFSEGTIDIAALWATNPSDHLIAECYRGRYLDTETTTTKTPDSSTVENNERVRGIKYCHGLRSPGIKINQWWLAPAVWPWSWETVSRPLIGPWPPCWPLIGWWHRELLPRIRYQ